MAIGVCADGSTQWTFSLFISLSEKKNQIGDKKLRWGTRDLCGDSGIINRSSSDLLPSAGRVNPLPSTVRIAGMSLSSFLISRFFFLIFFDLKRISIRMDKSSSDSSFVVVGCPPLSVLHIAEQGD